jgi:2-oxoglutarate dehydrogenase E2 component (dihydrolipoamide succinyltransferase)
MRIDVLMPEMGESITEGTVAKWLHKQGDRVDRDEGLLEITTDKVDSEIPAPASGVIVEILAEEGRTVPVGSVLARIETEEAPVRAKGRREQVSPSAPAPPLVHERPMSPVARSLARQEGLSTEELARIEGSGRGGRVTKDDVVRFLDQRSGRPAEGAEPAAETAEPVVSPAASTEVQAEGRVEIIEMTPMRKAIAEHMVRSKRISPHTYTVAEVDMTRIVRFREAVKARFAAENGFSLTYTPFILHATVLALKAHPLVNSSVDGDRIIRKDYIHLGVAVALESGLIVPVIRNADEKNLLGLARAAHELATRAQQKKLAPSDVQGGTFTVTNPGVFGNIFGLPIINQPQVGILGVGAIKKRPVVIDDAIAIRSIMYLSLSYDHRVIDGALAARFVQEIRKVLEEYDVDRAL